MRRPRTAPTLTGLLAVALLAGCSGSEEGGSPTPTVTAAPAPAQPTEPTTSTPSPEPDDPDDDEVEATPTEDPTDDPGTPEPTDEGPSSEPGSGSPSEPGAGGGSPGTEPTADPPAGALAMPEGSGCTPGEGPLPDGQWYGEAISADAAGVQFDLMCFFLGEEADKAALEDGEAMVPVPNGYYVRNDDPALRTFDVAGATQVLHYPTGDPGAAQVLDYPDWARLVAQGQILLPGIWLTIDDGAVVAVEEQWTP